MKNMKNIKTNNNTIKSKIENLIDILNSASKSYYQDDAEIISDFEYDKLYDELLELEEKYKIVFSNSPTTKVGYEVLDELEKIPHDVKMLSLDKTKDINKIESFIGEHNTLLSYKMDGLTIVLKYNKGKIISAVTRGNGEIGEDITHNVKMFKNIPLEIPYLDKLIIRGEALISFEEFEIINQDLEPEQKYKNPRNLCSGTVRQLNNEIAKQRNVKFLAFSLINNRSNNNNNNNNNFKFKSEQLDFLKSLGFQTVDYYKVNISNIRENIKNLEASINKNPFATDGLVVTFDDINYSQSLGSTSKFPKDAIAFKWADDLAETILLDIEWNTSRTGLINPVAIFEPVELEGTTVNRASLHNVSIIKKLKLGIGDTISVYKANMIIPQIAENYDESNTLEIPKKCNVCGGDSKIITIRDGEALKCINNNCEAKILRNIVHYVSRDGVNIEGFSKATIEKFMDNGFIENFTDIYFLENHKEAIISMKGFGEKSYNKIINAIDKSKNLNLYNYIYALGIPQIGLSNAKLLTKNLGNNIDDIIRIATKEYDKDDKNNKDNIILNIKGVGKIMIESLKDYFSNPENIENMNKVLPLLNIIDENNTLNNLEENQNSLENNSLKNKIFVITGSLDKFKNRKELQSKIEELGGKVSASVSKNTTYLINNNKTSSSSKNKSAIKFDVDIISEEDFINKFL